MPHNLTDERMMYLMIEMAKFTTKLPAFFLLQLSIVQAHLQNLLDTNKAMIVSINSAIGNQICLNLSAMLVPTGSANMAIQGNKVTTEQNKQCQE